MKELIEIQKALHVPKDQAPKNNMYNYRKVDDIIRAVKKIAPDNIFIILSDELVELAGNVYTKGTATISNGKESASASSYAKEGNLPGQSSPQISGSCSTYARKKALEGLLALDDGNDPDANPLPKEPKKQQNNGLASTYQMSALKGYMAAFKKEGDPKAIEHLQKHLDNKNLTDFEAENIISDIKKYLGVNK